MKHETTFFYFGIVKPITELSSNLKRQDHLRQDVYSYINDFGINYRRVGNVRTTFRIVFGKELDYIKGNPYNFVEGQTPYFFLMNKKMLKKYKLSLDKENEIISRVRQAGSVLKLQYYITYNWYYDGINEEALLKEKLNNK